MCRVVRCVRCVCGVRMCDEQPGFMMSVKPVEGAIRALKEMRAMGLDVRICCGPSPSPAERIQWMEHHFHTPGTQHFAQRPRVSCRVSCVL
jgi:hypothetical protein